LFQVAKHALLDMVRKVSVREPPVGRWEAGRSVALSQIRDDVTSLSRRLARRDDLNAFLDQASRMNDEDRRLLVHCGLEGLTVTEAAKRLGLGREAAFKRWQRLRARLADGPLPAGLLDA
jgi:DNA-directed RNA polymerase specialized sigma24 family protein